MSLVSHESDIRVYGTHTNIYDGGEGVGRTTKCIKVSHTSIKVCGIMPSQMRGKWMVCGPWLCSHRKVAIHVVVHVGPCKNGNEEDFGFSHLISFVSSMFGA